MKMSSILRSVISEDSRFEVLYNKAVKPAPTNDPNRPGKSLMSFESLRDIIFADPTTRKPDNFDIEGASAEDLRSEKVKVGKFTQWLMKNFLKPKFTDERNDIEPGTPEYKNMVKEYRRLFLEDLFKMTDLLTKFERIKGQLPEDKRDINMLTPESLTDLIVNLPQELKDKLNKNITKSQAREERKENKYAHPGGEIIHVGPNYTMIKIDGIGDAQREAAGWYGGYFDYTNGESHWCTSPPNSSYFLTYAKKGPLYVILANDDQGLVGERTGLPQERYQFHFPDSQFMDRMDRQINLVDFLNGKGAELKEVLKPEFAAGLTKNNGTKVEINYPNSSAGKFVALYGFDELFNSLPKDIITLNVVNSSNETIALDLSESLGQFTKLETLTLTNMVKSIPDSIGNCKELDILTLNNNPNLESLPDSIMNLPLTFISLKGSSNNLILPDGFNEKFDEMTPGSNFYTVSDLDFSDNDDLKK
jgi:hypothetical protein